MPCEEELPFTLLNQLSIRHPKFLSVERTIFLCSAFSPIHHSYSKPLLRTVGGTIRTDVCSGVVVFCLLSQKHHNSNWCGNNVFKSIPLPGEKKAISRCSFVNEKGCAKKRRESEREKAHCEFHGVRMGEKTVFHIYLTFASSGIVLRLTCSWSGPKPGVAAAAAAMVVGIS